MKVAILAEGQFAPATAKTAIGVLRYAPYEVVAVIDSTRAGKDAADCVGVGKGVPVVASVDDAIARGATVILIGTAAAGGRIPDGYRAALARTLERGVQVWNGLHERVFADPELAAAAKRGGAKVRELREPPPDLPIGGHRARREGARVVLTVGSDAAVGKMTASLEIVAALRRIGERAEFVATGQTGIAIAGQGIAVDAVVADGCRRSRDIVRRFAQADADTLFLEFCRNHGEEFDLEESIWLLARTTYPDINVEAYQAMLDGYAAVLRERINPVTAGRETLDVINKFLFEELIFAGNEVAYYDPYVPVIRMTREHPHWAGTKSVNWDRKIVEGFDAVIISTNHQSVNYHELAEWAACIVDTRNAMAAIKTKPGQVWKA